MAKPKTTVTNADVYQFINSFANTDQKKEDSYKLIHLMQKVTGAEPKMWGPSIIGFGTFHYISEKGTQEADWPLLGFSPRKAAISLYVFSGKEEHEYLLKDLGKFTMGKVCIYVKKLSDINQGALIKLMKASIKYLHSKYGKS